MAHLFGRHWTRAELLARIGDISQIGGVRPFVYTEGPEAGVPAVEVRTGGGLSFVVLPGRGMDIGAAFYNEIPLCWRSATGEAHSAYYEPSDQGWLRGFHGGLIVTCGLTTAGWSSVDEGVALPLHGRAAYLPARNVWADGEWQGDDYIMWVQGRTREAVALGENVRLTRRISARLGENRLWIEDRVENCDYRPVPHMIAYHVNPGFPILDEGSELIYSPREVTPAHEPAVAGLPNHTRYQGPRADWQFEVYHHRVEPDADGYATTMLVNRRFAGGRGIGLAVRQRVAELPWLWQWKQTTPRTYVTGIEPANCQGIGRAHERARGALRYLPPGEVVEYRVEIGVVEPGRLPG